MKKKHILILGGDVKRNIGDTIILASLLQSLIKVSNSCRITVWGEPPKEILPLQQVELLKRGLKNLPALISAIYGADLILWGGGQLLAGNRSSVKIPYWTTIIALCRILRRPIIGYCQGVGPLNNKVDQWLSRWAIKCTEQFFVRDPESIQELGNNGLSGSKIALAADPAVLHLTDHLQGTRSKGPSSYQKNSRPWIGLTPRYTHHHFRRLVPYQFLSPHIREKILERESYHDLKRLWTEIADWCTEELGAEVIFLPTYMASWETDLPLAKEITEDMASPERARICNYEDGLKDFLSVFDRLDLYIGTPMHGTIFATTRHVPTLSLYYETKGLAYFKRLRLTEWALPIIGSSQSEDHPVVIDRLNKLWKERESVRDSLSQRMIFLQNQARKAEHYLSKQLP